TYYRTEGIILTSLDSGEADRVFVVFTKLFGKVRLRAVSERKITSKLRGGLGTCAVVNLEFIQGKGGKTLTAAEIEIPYFNITKDLRRMRTAFSILCCVDALTGEEQEEQSVWRLMRNSLDALDKEPLDLKILSLLPYHFLWNLVSVTGYQPLLDSCVSCRQGVENRDVWFNAQDGGVRCASCAEAKGVKMSPETLRQLRNILRSDAASLSKAAMPVFETKAFRQASKDYLAHVLERIS
ncbi:MAG TPA: DNA repair protein RecO, partial [Candidatus Wildermuthbacteria bacterium]|nr:DNA repair protein RecO [Candidatus Wildermuthbacteria bacterium]